MQKNWPVLYPTLGSPTTVSVTESSALPITYATRTTSARVQIVDQPDSRRVVSVGGVGALSMGWGEGNHWRTQI